MLFHLSKFRFNEFIFNNFNWHVSRKTGGQLKCLCSFSALKWIKEAKICISAQWSAHVVLNVQSMYMKRKVFYKTKTETYDVIQSTRIENSSNDTRKIKQGQSPFVDQRWASCHDWTHGFRQIFEIYCAQLCCRGFDDCNLALKIIKGCEKVLIIDN